MDSTAKALIDHWDWAAERGLMNPNTAGTLHAACAKVLSIYDDLDAVDVRQLDVDDTVVRFRNLKAKDLKPDSLGTYENRFRQAVRSFIQYLDDPGGWKPAARPQAAGPRNKAKAANGNGGPHEQEAPAQVGGLVTYPFPIRSGLVAKISLPPDLKRAELQRVTAFMGTLTVDDEGAQ